MTVRLSLAVFENTGSLSGCNKNAINGMFGGVAAWTTAGYDTAFGQATCFDPSLKADLVSALAHWNSNQASGLSTYAAVSEWRVNDVTDFSALLEGLTTFNADMSTWETSAVTTMAASTLRESNSQFFNPHRRAPPTRGSED